MARKDVINTDGSIKWDTIGSFTEQLAETVQKSSYSGLVGYLTPREEIIIPENYKLSVPIVITKTRVGLFETNIEPINFYPTTTGITYYVNNVTGSNGNDGLTPATALKHPLTAYGKPDCETIICASGWYDRGQILGSITRNLKIKAAEGANVVFYSGQSTNSFTPLTWTLHDTTTYKTVRSVTSGVWDISRTDDKGDYIPLSKKASIAEVVATPNSYYVTGSDVYVHTFDNRVPDANIKVSVQENPMFVNDNVFVYLENIKFYFGLGTKVGLSSNPLNPTLLAKGCRFMYSDLYNGLNAEGAKLVILKDCEASNNQKDGFNYHNTPSVIVPEFIEINCIGRNNGKDNLGNNNGSTSHENYKGIRIGGNYYKNEGPNVADVQLSTSLNVGCMGSDSTTTVGIKADFYADSKMRLDNCYTKNSDYSILCGASTDFTVRSSIINKLVSDNVVFGD